MVTAPALAQATRVRGEDGMPRLIDDAARPLTGHSQGRRTFETDAAAAAGLRARRQLLSTTRQGYGT